jgi:hypothetical protein
MPALIEEDKECKHPWKFTFLWCPRTYSHEDQYLAHRTINVNPEFTSILRPLYEYYVFGVVDQDHMI